MTLEQVLKWKPGTRVVLSADLWSNKIDRVQLTIKCVEVGGRNILFEENPSGVTNMRFGVATSLDGLPRGIKVSAMSGWATIELLEGRNKL